jgi:expansin (peptidoglycan-binding protein)
LLQLAFGQSFASASDEAALGQVPAALGQAPAAAIGQAHPALAHCSLFGQLAHALALAQSAALGQLAQHFAVHALAPSQAFAHAVSAAIAGAAIIKPNAKSTTTKIMCLFIVSAPFFSQVASATAFISAKLARKTCPTA